MITISKIISYVLLAYARNLYLFYVARFLRESQQGNFSLNNGGNDNCRDTVYSGCWSSNAFENVHSFLYDLLGNCPYRLFVDSAGKMSSAKKVLMKLRNMDSQSAEKDLVQLARSIEEENSNESKFTDIFRTPSLRKGVIICFPFNSSQEFIQSRHSSARSLMPLAVKFPPTFP